MRSIPRRIQDSWAAFLATALIFAWAAAADAQRIRRPKSDFHVGQKVEFEWMGKSQSGEVTGIEMTGWVKVRFQDNGNDRDWTFPPDQVRLPKKPAVAAKTTKFPMRTWTDSSWKFKLDARFVAMKDGKVTLEKADGTTKTLPLDKLSEEDQAAAKKFDEKASSVNPFEGSDEAAAPAAAPAEAEPANDDEIVAPAGDWSVVRSILVDISSKGEFVPDASAGEPLKQMPSVMMDLTKGAKDREFMWEKPAGLFYDRSRQRLIVASTNNDPRGGHPGPRLEACDLRSGRSLGAIVLQTGIAPCDLSPDGSSVVCMPTQLVSAFHKRRGVEVWRMESGGKLVKRWDPNDTRGKEEMFQVDHAQFISRESLLTVNSMGGKATVWDIEHARAEYSLSIDSRSLPALSANRKQLAVISSGVVCVLDAATGQTLLALTSAGSEHSGGAPTRGRRFARNASQLAFRPDGRQLAVLGNGVVQIWDLQKQALVQQIWLPQTGARVESKVPEWVDNNYLLLNGSDLIDLAKQIVLWHYDIPGDERAASAVINGRLSFAASERDRGPRSMKGGIFFLALPHREAEQVAAGLSVEKLMALKPGAQVSLDLRFPTTDPQDLDAITASYTEQLKSYNVAVLAGAPFTFRATVEAGKTESRTYRSIGRLGGDETVNFTTQKCRLALVENGNVLWERSGEVGTPGFMVSHKEDETLQAAIDKGTQKAIVDFFRNAALPGCVARQGEHGAYGFSRVTPMGLVAYDPTAEPATPPRGRMRR